jgi:uncharacterized glyoxalase superfamily protein PhnB
LRLEVTGFSRERFSAMPKTMRFVLNVADFDAVVDFYKEALGFASCGGWDRGRADRGALLQIAPGAVVEVVGHGPSFRGPRYYDDAIAVELDDREEVDRYHQRLVSAGLRVSSPTLQSWGHYSMSLRDPVELEIVLFADVT